MNSYTNELGLDFLPNHKIQSEFFFFNEQIRFKIRKKNRKIKIAEIILKFKQKYQISEFSSISIKEILKLKIFTQEYSANEVIVVKNLNGILEKYKIFSMYSFTYLKELEELKIIIIIKNIQNEEFIIEPDDIKGKPFIFDNTIINILK
jgi:hypothetical protein